jgi:uncharacterized protein YkwD
MRTTCRKLLIVAGLTTFIVALAPRSPASAACAPGTLLCPPEVAPAPTPLPAPEPTPQPTPEPKPEPKPEPTPAPQPAPAPATQPAAASEEQSKARLVELINRDRVAEGLPALSLRNDLDGIADAHSAEMAKAQQIYHNDDLFTAATKARIGARSVGENVALNKSIDDAHRRLLASPGHRANLLSPSFSLLGIGLANVNGTWYITEVFIQPTAGARAPAGAAKAPSTTSASPRQPAAPRAARSAVPAATPTTGAAAPVAETSAVESPVDIDFTTEAVPVEEAASTTTATATTPGLSRTLGLAAAIAVLGVALVAARRFRSAPSLPKLRVLPV